MHSLKKTIHHHFHQDGHVLRFIYTLILVNVVVLIVASHPFVRDQWGGFFYGFEFFSVMVFSAEYLLRIWTADLLERYEGPAWKKRLRYMVSFMGLIDLLAILPFYLPLVMALDLRVLRILRLFRLLRIFKLKRFSKSMQTIQEVLVESKEDLSITILVAFVLLLVSSTLMYYVEGEAQPDKFASIIHSFWWSIATLTTVGYGDVYPITGMGKFLSAVIAMIGIGFVALPTGIISSAFIDKIKQRKMTCTCPKCGESFTLEGK
jgi:voltage-gated potassium channel